MRLPDDAEKRLRCYCNALRNCRFRGYVRFKPLAEEWLVRELSEFDLQEVAQILHEYVEAGGEIDEQVERRPEYADDEFHYDLRVKIGERHVYFETVLRVLKDADDPDDPIVIVVNAHDV